jgi:hypothetical protein
MVNEIKKNKNPARSGVNAASEDFIFNNAFETIIARAF